jgi:hypothetical protein
MATDRMNADPRPNDSALDWHIAMTARPNVLVMGPTDVVEQSLAALMPHLDLPVRYWAIDTLLPSRDEMTTLVIRNVDTLSASEQRALSSLFEQMASTWIRVISTTTVPLFQLVSAGLFLDGLYYRLNTVTLVAPFQPPCDEVAEQGPTTDDVRAAADPSVSTRSRAQVPAAPRA